MIQLGLVEDRRAWPHLERELEALPGPERGVIRRRARRELETAWAAVDARTSRRPVVAPPVPDHEEEDEDDALAPLGPSPPPRRTSGAVDDDLVERCFEARCYVLLLAAHPEVEGRVRSALARELEEEERAREARRRRNGAGKRKPAERVLEGEDADHLGGGP